MMNLGIDEPSSLKTIVIHLAEEIKKQNVKEEEKEKFFHNLEKAYKLMEEELFGSEEENEPD
jgi:hypothetical protein